MHDEPEEPCCVDEFKGEEGTCPEPGAEDSEYCHQCTVQCFDHYLGTRDEWGSCDWECGCVEDEWQLECSIGDCEAECSEDADCNDDNPDTIDSCMDCMCVHEEECGECGCEEQCGDCPECDRCDCEPECGCEDDCEKCDDCGCEEECEGDCNEAPRIITYPDLKCVLDEMYYYDVYAIDPDGDAVYYSLIEAPEDMVIDQVTGLIQWHADDDWTVRVTVIAQDGDGAYDMQEFQLGDCTPDDELYPRRKLKIETIRMDYQVWPFMLPGDQMFVDINFRNTGTYDVDRSQVRFTLPELGLSRQVGMFDGPDVNEALRRGTIFDLPEGAEPGVYTLRTTVYTEDGAKRTRHREFSVVE
jgi:hypothetical protein